MTIKKGRLRRGEALCSVLTNTGEVFLGYGNRYQEGLQDEVRRTGISSRMETQRTSFDQISQSLVSSIMKVKAIDETNRDDHLRPEHWA